MEGKPGCFHIVIGFVLLSLMVTLSSWDLRKEKNGVKVYTRASSKEDSKLKDSKASMTVETTTDRVVEVLFDIPNYVNWIPKCKKAKVIKEISDDEMIYWAEYAAPMVSNRDIVLRMKVIKASGGVVKIKMTGEADYIDEKDKLVRIPTFSGWYVLTPKDDGKVEIVNWYSTHPGGGVPDWLANTASVDTPYDTFMGLKEQL